MVIARGLVALEYFVKKSDVDAGLRTIFAFILDFIRSMEWGITVDESVDVDDVLSSVATGDIIVINDIAVDSLVIAGTVFAIARLVVVIVFAAVVDVRVIIVVIGIDIAIAFVNAIAINVDAFVEVTDITRCGNGTKVPASVNVSVDSINSDDVAIVVVDTADIAAVVDIAAIIFLDIDDTVKIVVVDDTNTTAAVVMSEVVDAAVIFVTTGANNAAVIFPDADVVVDDFIDVNIAVIVTVLTASFDEAVANITVVFVAFLSTIAAVLVDAITVVAVIVINVFVMLNAVVAVLVFIGDVPEEIKVAMVVVNNEAAME